MTDTLVEQSDGRLLKSGSKMLTRQSVIAETTCVETVPINFVATEDGRTLLVVTEHEDGVVEIVATPMTLTTQNNAAAGSLVKNLDGNVLLHPPVFQISLEDIGGSALQQSTLLPVQPVESTPVVFQRDVFQVNEEIQRERSVPSTTVRATDNVPLERTDRKESMSAEKTVDKRNPGRPKKHEISYLQSVENLRCDICQREFTKQSSYRKHLESHVEEKPHRCPKCPASFNIPTNFTLHMATHNSGDPKCPECGKKFARMASLKAHMLLHEKEENLFCTECEDAFTTKAQLDAHLKLHGEKWTSEEARKCKLCNKQFVQPALYRLHIREHYRLQTKVVKQTKRGAKHKTMYKCTICLKSFQKPSQLMRHIRVHTGEKPFKCTICGRAFTQKSSLQIHTWQHNGIRPHTCDLCNARFSQKGNLNAHILRVHNAPEGEPIYGCTYCSCIFKKLGSLNGHIKRMHTNLNEEKSVDKCSDADMRATVDSVMSQLATLESTANDSPNPTDSRSSCVTKNDILQQALRNSGLPNTLETKRLEARTNFVTLMDRSPDGGTRKYLTIRQRCVGNVRWYACSFCHKEFKKPSDLIRHLRVHTQEKPFKCSHCFRSFALKSTMIAHERTHTGGKRYSCGSCNKTFACHGSLAAHARLHAKHPKYTTDEHPRILDSEVVAKHRQARIQSKGKSKLSPEAESLVPQVVLQEPLVICDAGNKICVAQVPPKQKRTYEEGVLDVARPHKCWVCHAAFRKISHLKQHYRRHTGERPYKCAKCDRRFTSNSVLKSHLHTHDDSRPYSCSVCSTKFSTQSSMKRHLVTHSNKRPFMCPYCHKTFKTYVNCRKHMKIHKHELAQRQLEQQRTQGHNGSAVTLTHGDEVKKAPREVVAATDNLAISEDIGISFQSQIGTEDFTEAFSEQLKSIADEKGKSLSSGNNGVTAAIVNQSLPGVSMTDLGNTQMLHADETGTVTLPTYAGDQTLTPESIREIEETLNQQLFGIGMNLDNGREQPVLSVIYENNKNIEPHGGNVFGSQFDSFDMTQIALQSDNEIGITLDTANSTSMASILPRSAKEEQRLIPVTTCANHLAQDVQAERPDSQAMLLVSKQNSLETPRLAQPYQKYTRTVGKDELVNVDPAEKQPNGTVQKHCGIDVSTLQSGTSEISFVEEEFRDSAQPKAETKVRAALSAAEVIDSNDAHESTETSARCETRLQCHMCSEQGFTATSLKEHLKTHRGEKEYQCTECSLRFRTNGGLSRHSKIHANKQQWKCTACQKILNSKAQVRSHSRLHDVAWNVTSSEIGESRKGLLSSDAKADSAEGCSMNAAIIESDSSISEKVLLDTVAEKEVMERAESASETTKERKEYTNKCKYCPKTFRKPSDLVRHVRTHTGERPYKCDYCSKSFAVKCTLDSHMKVHTGKKTFRCHVCSSFFATKGSLKVHMRLHTGSKPFRCSICDLRFRTSGHRKVHLLKHAKEHKGITKRRQKHLKVAAIAEVAANLEKSSERSLKPPLTTEHRQENASGTDFTSLGGIGFEADSGSLTDQITFNSDGTVSNNNSVLSVNDCNQLVANLQFLLANGLVTIQTEETLLPQPPNLEHRPTQIVDSAINGPPIESSGNEVNDLNNETRRVVQAVMQSNNCAFGSTRLEPQLKVERAAEKQTNRGTPSKKECDVCGKIFMKPYQVERHKRIHTGERPYKCDLCTKSFAQKSTLQMHQKHHTGDRPYPCPHCEYSFTQKGNLQTHVKRVHQLDTLEIKKLRRARQPFVAKSLQENLTEVKILSLDDISFVEFLK